MVCCLTLSGPEEVLSKGPKGGPAEVSAACLPSGSGSPHKGAQRVWQWPSCLLEEELLIDSDLTGLGKFSVWRANGVRGGKANIWLQFPCSLPATPLGDSSICSIGSPFPFHTISRSFGCFCLPSHPGSHSQPDGHFPVAFCGSPVLQFTTQCL